MSEIDYVLTKRNIHPSKNLNVRVLSSANIRINRNRKREVKAGEMENKSWFGNKTPSRRKVQAYVEYRRKTIT